MSKSRARLAADWFAKLRQNAVTQEVEHTDVVDAEAEALEAIADAAAGSTAADVLAKLKTVDGAGSGLDADLLDGYGSADTSAANTVVRRNVNGDINARLFRSEYDSTNASINYIMTQVDTASNNYIRPSTIAQVRNSLGIVAGTRTATVGTLRMCWGQNTAVRGGTATITLPINYGSTGNYAVVAISDNGNHSGASRAAQGVTKVSGNSIRYAKASFYGDTFHWFCIGY